MKKIKFFAIGAALTLSACSVALAEEETEIADDTIAGWHIAVEDMQISDSLENISIELGYEGVETTDFSMEAEEGDTFCLLKLLIEKDGSTEVIDWEKMILTDEEGDEFTRMEDDFLVDLGMMRMPGTTLNFGSNEGWVAYEIPADASGLTLTYAFEEETFSCALPEVETADAEAEDTESADAEAADEEPAEAEDTEPETEE